MSRNLYEVIRDMAPSGGAGGGAFFEQGTVRAVKGNGDLQVETSRGAADVRPVNDEAYSAGDKVWVSQASDGSYLACGKVR